jgi:hypothetical protein
MYLRDFSACKTSPYFLLLIFSWCFEICPFRSCLSRMACFKSVYNFASCTAHLSVPSLNSVSIRERALLR